MLGTWDLCCKRNFKNSMLRDLLEMVYVLCLLKETLVGSV